MHLTNLIQTVTLAISTLKSLWTYTKHSQKMSAFHIRYNVTPPFQIFFSLIEILLDLAKLLISKILSQIHTKDCSFVMQHLPVHMLLL
jgi:hypothetical protein